MSRSQKREELRRKFFARGVEALARIGAQPAGFYVCPICLDGYSEGAVAARALTLEHIPPQGLGGRELTLTCVRCNPGAGSTVDAAAIREASIEGFWLDGGTSVVRLTMGGHKVSVKATRTPDGGMFVVGRPKHSDPKAQAGWIEHMQSKVGKTDWGLTLSFPSYDTWQARVGWLRTAYLAAFVQLGYRYVAHPALERIRTQVNKPEEKLLDLFEIANAEANPAERALWLMTEPVPCIGVQVGRRLILLPWPPSGVSDPHQALREHMQQVPEFTFQGQPFAWPRGMVMSWDFQELKPREAPPGSPS